MNKKREKNFAYIRQSSIFALAKLQRRLRWSIIYGKVLYGQLPSNPPGPDRSKGSWL